MVCFLFLSVLSSPVQGVEVLVVQADDGVLHEA